VETEVICETSDFSELKQLVSEVKHVGLESFLFCKNKTAVTFCSEETKRPLLFVLKKQKRLLLFVLKKQKRPLLFVLKKQKRLLIFVLKKQNGRYFLF